MSKVYKSADKGSGGTEIKFWWIITLDNENVQSY